MHVSHYKQPNRECLQHAGTVQHPTTSESVPRPPVPFPFFFLIKYEHIATVQLWFLLIRSASVWYRILYGSHAYIRIRSHLGSAEPILNQKCLQGIVRVHENTITLV